MNNIVQKPIMSRASVILGLISVVFLGTFIAAIITGSQSGEINKKFLLPIKNALASLGKSLSASSTSQVNFSNSSSSSQMKINTTNQVTTVPTVQPVYRQQYIYNSPTPNPTAVEFDRQTQLKMDQMKKDFNDAKAQTCAANPSAPGCH